MGVRALLVGCGRMSGAWLEACNRIDGIELAGLVDLDLEAARRQAHTYGLAGAACGTDLTAMLDRVRPDILFDVAVPEARRAVVEAGLAHGCHVLTEKPMATSLADARHLVARAAEARRVYAVVQNRRFVAGVRRMRRFSASGAIGALTGIHCDFFIAPHFGGFRETMDHVLLLDMAIHTFDAARFVADTRPLAVYCRETNPKGSWFKAGAAADAIFELADGITFTYRGSWVAEGLRTSWESAWRLVGEAGSLIWDGGDGFAAERPVGRDGLLSAMQPIAVPPLDPGDAVGGHEGVIRDFLGAIANGHAPECPGSDNIHSLAMVLAAIRSAETGAPVRIGDEMELRP